MARTEEKYTKDGKRFSKYRNQDARIHIRMDAKTKQRLFDIAEATNSSISGVIREWAANRNVIATVDVQAVKHLSRTGGLLKHAIVELRASGNLSPTLHEEFESVLSEISEAVQQIVSRRRREEA